MQEATDDIVFTCPPLPYEFDEVRYRTQGMGGSETALLEIARLLKAKTKRNVKVFRYGRTCIGDSGVEYFDIQGNITDHFLTRIPRVHISWRHNYRLTYAKTFLWAHEIRVDGIDSKRNFDFVLCLSNFHKNFIHRHQWIPSRKIIVTRNGIDPDKLHFDKSSKNPNKIVWMCSPDRGLKSALLVLDILVKSFPKLELHVYYGVYLLYMNGHEREADELKGMIASRPYVNYHGSVEQSQMYREVADAVVWLYPCNILETFCVTALEMLALGVFPVTRKYGALAETLREAEQEGGAILLEHSRITDNDIEGYASGVSAVLRGRLWAKVSLDLQKHSWSSVADEWIEFMNLS